MAEHEATRIERALDRLLRGGLGLLIWVALVLLRATWRVRTVGALPAGPVLFAFWHGDMAALSAGLGHFSRSVTVLTSRSRDGQVGAWVAARLGLRVVRGSSSNGAVTAAHALARQLVEGVPVALAVDGPRGPAQRASDASLRLAALAGAATVPVVAVARRFIRMRSWDRLQIPAPFTRIVVSLGEPVEGDLQQRLGRLRREAERQL